MTPVVLVAVALTVAAAPSTTSSLSVAGHACAIVDGGVVCWGAGHFGQLGREARGQCALACEASPHTVNGLPGKAAAVVAGANTTCAILAGSGAVYCWGEGHVGQLGPEPQGCCGNELNTWACSSSPVGIAGLEKVTRVAVGYHVCAVSNGAVWCWGDNTSGQLGQASTELCGGNLGAKSQPSPSPQGLPCSTKPLRVPGIDNAVDVVVGEGHTCALSTGGDVWCWGQNERGALGFSNAYAADVAAKAGAAAGASSSSSPSQPQPQRREHVGPAPPTKVPGLKGIVGLSSDGVGSSTCAWDRATQGWCWGSGGAVVDPKETCTLRPNADAFALPCTQAPRSIIDGVKAMSVGFTHACALLENGTVSCWGDGGNSDLAQACGAGGCSAKPVVVAGVVGATQVAAGEGQTCAVVDKQGAIKCWGRNALGGLGDGSTTSRTDPRPIASTKR